MKKRIVPFALALILCFALVPSAALAGAAFPGLEDENYEPPKAPAKEEEMLDEMRNLANSIERGAPYSADVIEEIDKNIAAAKTQWVRDNLRSCKAFALYKYGKYDEGLYYERSDLNAELEEKDWESAANQYAFMAHIYSDGLGYKKKAAEYYRALLELEKAAGTPMDESFKEYYEELLAELGTIDPNEPPPPPIISVKAPKGTKLYAVAGDTVLIIRAAKSETSEEVGRLEGGDHIYAQPVKDEAAWVLAYSTSTGNKLGYVSAGAQNMTLVLNVR